MNDERLQQQEYFTVAYKENANEEEYQRDGRTISKKTSRIYD